MLSATDRTFRTLLDLLFNSTKLSDLLPALPSGIPAPRSDQRDAGRTTSSRAEAPLLDGRASLAGAIWFRRRLRTRSRMERASQARARLGNEVSRCAPMHSTPGSSTIEDVALAAFELSDIGSEIPETFAAPSRHAAPGPHGAGHAGRVLEKGGSGSRLFGPCPRVVRSGCDAGSEKHNCRQGLTAKRAGPFLEL